MNKLILLIGALLLTSGLAHSEQIYETTDAEGNKSFSDTPTPNATEVDLGTTNTMPAVEAPPSPPQSNSQNNGDNSGQAPVVEQQVIYQQDGEDDNDIIYTHGRDAEDLYYYNRDDDEGRRIDQGDGERIDTDGEDRPRVDHRITPDRDNVQPRPGTGRLHDVR